MKAITVTTENVVALFSAIKRITKRGAAIPGIGLIYGRTGAGKTTALRAAVGMFGAIFIRAFVMGGASSLMDDLCYELGIEPTRFKAQKFQAIVSALQKEPRPIFIDEADYLCRHSEMLDLVRDLHDMSNVPVFLIGMEGIEKRLAAKHPQFARRVSEPIQFGACTLNDAKKLAAELCEGVTVAPDLIAEIKSRAEGNVGLVVMALTHIESYCRGYRLATIDKAQWGDMPMFLEADQERAKAQRAQKAGAV